MTARAKLITDIQSLQAMHPDLCEVTIVLDMSALDGLLHDLRFAGQYASKREYKGAAHVQGRAKP